MVFSTFFIGSHRYRECFPNHFPPILHSTREILNFLRKYSSGTLTFTNNVEFGDALHPFLRSASLEFLKHNSLATCDTLVLEISTRKVAYVVGSDTPLNAHYVQHYGNIPNYDIRYLSDEEIQEDIRAIQALVKEHWGAHVILIPPINLPYKETGMYIPERTRLYNSIMALNNPVWNVSKFLEESYPKLYLEDILPDTYYFSPVFVSVVNEFLKVSLRE